MKTKILFCFLILVSIMFCTGSCNNEKIPGIKFADLVYKFGEVDEGEEVSYTFTFINSGTDTLVITNVKPTCGCTVPGDYTKEVEPGKTGEIPVVFHSKGFQGGISKTIRVETNIPNSEPIGIRLEGTVKVLISNDPRSIWLGQTRKDGPPITGSVTLKNHVDTPLNILKVEASDKRAATKIITIKEGEEYAIEVTVSPPFLMEQVREILTIMTNIEGKKKFEIQYYYYGISDIEVAPKEMIIYMKHLQPDLTRIITVRSHIDATIDVIDPQVNGENIDIKVEEIDKGKHIQIIVHFKEGFKFPENETLQVSFGVKSEQGETKHSIPIKDGEKL